MTVEEVHQYYNAVCQTDFIIEMRVWIEKYLDAAYEAGFKNAKKGEL